MQVPNKDNYQNIDRGIELTILSNRLKLITKRENKEYLQKTDEE